MAKSEETTRPTPELKSVEELKATLGISNTVFAGVLQANGWAEGLAMTQKAFEDAVAKWLNGPVHGRRK